MTYVAVFKERDDVRSVYRTLKDAYGRRGNPSDIKMNCKEILIPDDAVSLLERIANRLDVHYKVMQK